MYKSVKMDERCVQKTSSTTLLDLRTYVVTYCTQIHCIDSSTAHAFVLTVLDMLFASGAREMAVPFISILDQTCPYNLQ